jgi:hypothetical protein
MVPFWNMGPEGDTCFQSSREGDAFEWVSPETACQRLDYAVERRLIRELFPCQLGKTEK